MPANRIKFEDAISRLTVIVSTIEDGETTLDGAITLYKEGLTLAQKCGDILGSYEAEVLQLQQEADGAFLLTPFSEGANND